MAAGVCAGRGLSAVLFDKNPRPGRKLRITGKGRCNVTNQCAPQDVIAACHGGKFLYSALTAFPPQAVMEFFEGLGVPLKVERGNRVFPQSDRAHDIADALARFASGAEYIPRAVTEILTEEGRAVGVAAGGKVYKAPRVLIACGGASYPATGSDGSGFRLAEGAGHTVTDTGPSLVPLTVGGDTCGRLMGLSLRNVGMKVTERGGKKPVYTDFGELLFTHFGLSGPIILSASARLRPSPKHPMEPGRYTVHLDLKPALDEGKLDARLVRDLEENRNRVFANSLDRLLPKKLIPVVVERSGIPPDLRCNAVTKEQRRGLLGVLKDFTLTVEGFRPLSEAIVTAGGVSLREVDPGSMESKLVKGLYFAGEVLDLDGPTGGYNLQIAFSTGRLAGESMAGSGQLDGPDGSGQKLAQRRRVRADCGVQGGFPPWQGFGGGAPEVWP